MKYRSGQIIRAGDNIRLGNGVAGMVVCDFDHRENLEGYKDWDPDTELLGG